MVKNSSGSGMLAGDSVYISGDSSGIPLITLSDADAAASCTGKMLCLAEDIANTAIGRAVERGPIAGFSGLTANKPQYFSTTAGDFTETVPSGSSDIARIAGYAISTTEIWFEPGQSWVEIA